jgi:TonB-dependent receptor
MNALTRARRVRPLLLGCALAALSTGHAAAQTADAPADEEIVVQGSFARSIEEALEIKRRADSITDAVSAADIADFPSVNVAEALQRVPGVSISREAGEGQFVSVRGLGPNFQSVTLGGLPIAYNENIRNSDQSGRQFQFRVIPADLIAAVVVTKAPTADLVDGGIGANIDIRLARPLSTAPFLTARAFGHWEERTHEVTPNGTVSAAWRNEDQTFGVIGGISYQTRKVQFDRFQHFGYTDRTIAGATVSVPNDMVATLEREDRRRISASGGIEMKPADSVTLRVESLYSNFNNEIFEDRVSFEWGGRTDFAARLVPGSARVVDGVLHAGTINGGRINRNAEFSEQTHENLFVRGSVDYEEGGWTINQALSFSRADSGLDLPLQRIDGRTADNAPGLTYSFDYGDDPVGNAHIARIQTNLDLTQAAAAPYYRYRIRTTNSRDEDFTAQIDVARDLGGSLGGIEFGRLKTGFMYTDRSRDYQRRDRSASPRPGTTIDASFTDQLLPSNVFDKTVGDFFGRWASYDRGQFTDAFILPGEYDGVDPQSADLVANGQDLQQSYAVAEEIYAGYLRADFASTGGGIALRGNVGVRYVKTETTVDGTLLRAATGAGGVATTVITPAQFVGSYDKWLPSANLNFEFTPELMLRLAASRTMTRPSLADLRTATVPNSSVLADVYDRGQIAINQSAASSRNGVGGNPTLRPYTSINLDASLEYYLSGFGGLSAAVFHKRIDDFIGSISRTESLVLNTRAGETLTADFLITRPQNIGKAEISGVEFGAAVDLIGGFGVAASATFTESSADIATPAGTVTARLQGVSDTSFSISPFFKLGGFEANLSYTYRSEFTVNGNISAGSNAVTNPLDAVVADDFGTLDFGAKFRITPEFEIFAQGTNILDARQAAYQGRETRPYQIHEYGRSVDLGVRATF